MSSLLVGRGNLEEVTRFHGHEIISQQDNCEDEIRMPDENTRRNRIRFAVAGALLVCILLIVIDSLTARRVESASTTFLSWVEVNPTLGIVAVIAMYTLATGALTMPLRHKVCFYIFERCIFCSQFLILFRPPSLIYSGLHSNCRDWFRFWCCL